MKKLLAIVLVVAVAMIAVNDIGRYFTTMYNLDNTADEAARNAAQAAARGADRNTAGRAAVEVAGEQGVRLWGYDQRDGRVYVFAEQDVAGTVVFAPLSALLSGKPLDTVYVMRRESDALIQ